MNSGGWGKLSATKQWRHDELVLTNETVDFISVYSALHNVLEATVLANLSYVSPARWSYRSTVAYVRPREH